MSNSTLKLHNAMWPGLVGKEPGTDHPPISLDNMLDFTVKAQVNGQKFDGVDLFLFHSHTDPDASTDDIKKMADKIASKGLNVGSVVAPIWPGTVGDSSFGSPDQRAKFVLAVKKLAELLAFLMIMGFENTVSFASMLRVGLPIGLKTLQVTLKKLLRLSAKQVS